MLLCHRATQPHLKKGLRPCKLQEVDSLHAPDWLRFLVLLDFVVMPAPCADVAFALMRFPVTYGRAVTDKAHDIVSVVKEGL